MSIAFGSCWVLAWLEQGDNSRFPPYLRDAVGSHTFIGHVKQPTGAQPVRGVGSSRRGCRQVG